MSFILPTLAMGIIATIVIDIWATFSNKILKYPRTNWAMVGRWLGHLPSGKISHNPISAAKEVKNELLLGWAFHYFIGISYAALYLLITLGLIASTPTLFSAWLFGVATIISPWFILQPGLGLGICAHKAQNPNLVRLQNLIIHSLFGIALYWGWIGVNQLL